MASTPATHLLRRYSTLRRLLPLLAASSLLIAFAPSSLVVDASASWLAISHVGSQQLPSSTHHYKQHYRHAPGQPGSRPAAVCRKLPGLNRRQIKWCRINLPVMDSVRQGAHEAYAECQWQFAKRRWNCTMIDPTTQTVFGDVVLRQGTREAAFVHAMYVRDKRTEIAHRHQPVFRSAAGVAYRITKDCSRGTYTQCGCDHTHHSTSSRKGDGHYSAYPAQSQSPSLVGASYSYKGCSDNVHFGIAAAEQFVDAAEKERNQSSEEKARSMMNQHNNRAGRELLHQSLRRECKCHGVSGACEVKTCWDALPSFREIGNNIKDKFDGATEVTVVELDSGASQSGNDKAALLNNGKAASAKALRMERKNPFFKRHTHADLVYLDASPDYCEPDLARGVLGTQGRQCNASSLAIDGCDLLCCHRGHDRRVEVVKERCHCKFHYCCRVECKTCERLHETYTCK